MAYMDAQVHEVATNLMNYTCTWGRDCREEFIEVQWSDGDIQAVMAAFKVA
jgi:hypothetical protein